MREITANTEVERVEHYVSPEWNYLPTVLLMYGRVSKLRQVMVIFDHWVLSPGMVLIAWIWDLRMFRMRQTQFHKIKEEGEIWNDRLLAVVFIWSTSWASIWSLRSLSISLKACWSASLVWTSDILSIQTVVDCCSGRIGLHSLYNTLPTNGFYCRQTFVFSLLGLYPGQTIKDLCSAWDFIRQCR